jgi:hypothetical protein
VRATVDDDLPRRHRRVCGADLGTVVATGEHDHRYRGWNRMACCFNRARRHRADRRRQLTEKARLAPVRAQAGEDGYGELGKLTRNPTTRAAQTENRSRVTVTASHESPQPQTHETEDGTDACDVGEERRSPQAPSHAGREWIEVLRHHRLEEYERGDVFGKPMRVDTNDPGAERVPGEHERPRQVSGMNQAMQIVGPPPKRPFV